MKPPLPRRRGPTPFRRSGAFTLLELLVVSAIVAALAGVSWPILGGMVTGLRRDMAASRVEAAMQSNALFARKYKRADMDAAEPRVPGATYFGGALVFDDASHKAWFTLNQQQAVDPTKTTLDPTRFLEVQPDPDMAGTDPKTGLPYAKKAYARIAGEDIEAMDLPEALVYYGVAWDPSAAPGAQLTLLAPPFAVCAAANGESMPQRKYLQVDLLDGAGFRKVPTVLPWVLAVPRDAGIGFDAADLSTVPGATDMEKLDNLVKIAHGRLVAQAINGATKI